MLLRASRPMACFIFVLVAGLVYLQEAAAATITAGATPGQFAVTPTGAAQYTIPIAVPPGTAGMAPNLSLVYNSQGGNGLLGVGWSLSGLSAITRCPKTLIQDGVKTGVNLDANDVYCLDGRRLVAISGTYGANGTQYRTERDGFSQIISYGTSPCPAFMPVSPPSKTITPAPTTCPGWFQVKTKSGQIMQFGNTTGNTSNSAILAQGTSAIRVWAVNQISDTKGNYLTVTYNNDNTHGQYYPTQINYTGNPNPNPSPALAPYNSVQFVYAARPDIVPLYLDNTLIENTVRLTNIQTYTPVNGTSTMVKNYQINYTPGGATQRSLISSIQECDGAATPTCVPATAMGWQGGGSNSFGTAALWTPGDWESPGYSGLQDLNGDGLADFWYIPDESGGSGQMMVQLNNGAEGLGTATQANTDVELTYFYVYEGTYGANLSGFQDMNGDGLADFWYVPYYSSQLMVQLNTGTGTGFAAATQWANPPVDNWGGNLGLQDINGDGLPDLWYVPSGTSAVDVQLNTGTGFVPATQWANPTGWVGQGTGWAGSYFGFQDMNGDGLADLWFVPSGTSEIKVQLSTGTGFGTAALWTPSNTGWAGQGFFGIQDINGDGLPDLWFVPSGTSKSRV
jgi:hypothetical protein